MKKYFLLWLLAASCAQMPSVKEISISGDLNLQQLASNPAFVKDESGNFESVPESAEYIRIYRYSFSSQNELQSYVLNRRMLLHKSFQDEIAPYFGLIQLNRTCLAKVDTKGEIQQMDKFQEVMKMTFPANDKKTLSDCSTNTFWGSIEYRFYNCKKENEVFEIRLSHRDGAKAKALNPRCR